MLAEYSYSRAASLIFQILTFPGTTNNGLVRLKEMTQHPYKAGCHPGIFVEVNEGADRIEPLKIKREPYGSELLAG